MELKSLSYVAFALAVVALYYGVRKVKNGQRCVLLAANLFFILATSGLKSLLIITLCVAISYGAGILIEKNILLEQKSKARRAAGLCMPDAPRGRFILFPSARRLPQ